MSTDCPSCKPLTMRKRTRWLVFTDTLPLSDRKYVRADVAVVLGSVDGRTRHGHARIACCCDESGYGRRKLGASSCVVYGRNTTRLFEVFRETETDIVFVALVPGTGRHGRGTKAIREACERAGRELHVVMFADRATCHVDPHRDPRVIFAPVGNGNPPRP